MADSSSTTSTPICSRCGSPLVFISKKTEIVENSRFPTTTTIYKCSNPICQEEKEKSEEARIKHKTEQEAAKKKREEEKAVKKKQLSETI